MARWFRCCEMTICFSFTLNAMSTVTTGLK